MRFVSSTGRGGVGRRGECFGEAGLLWSVVAFREGTVAAVEPRSGVDGRMGEGGFVSDCFSGLGFGAGLPGGERREALTR